jgi:PhzF family phenazine biosynthesis protein
MPLKVVYVDAFTDEAFRGNPAVVCFMDEARDAAWMQRVAREMNQSETAFLSPAREGFDLRWFTPAVEVDLCGHATLASAHALWESGRLPRGEAARFHTKSGLLTAAARDGWIEMDFPRTDAEGVPSPPGLAEALGIRPGYVGRSAYDLLVELPDEAAVRGVKPDFAALGRLGGRGVMVTSRASTPGVDFVSRFFAPAAGINEDPVTGSAHSCLTPFWAERLSRDALVAHQLSPRGGVLRLKLAGRRVLIAGQGVTVMRGELVA